MERSWTLAVVRMSAVDDGREAKTCNKSRPYKEHQDFKRMEKPRPTYTLVF
jgi:hypothetical protein